MATDEEFNNLLKIKAKFDHEQQMKSVRSQRYYEAHKEYILSQKAIRDMKKKELLALAGKPIRPYVRKSTLPKTISLVLKDDGSILNIVVVGEA
jgi:hypothetical protein